MQSDPAQVPPPGYPHPQYQVPMPPREIDIEGTFSKAWKIYSSNWHFFVAFFLTAVLISALVSFMIYGSAESMFSPGLPGSDSEVVDPEQIMSQMLGFAAIAMVGGILSLVAQALFMGGMVGMAAESLETGSTSLSTGFKTINKRFLAILVTYLAFSIIVAIGFFLCCIPGIFFCYWWLFAFVIVVVETSDISEAFRESKRFALHHKTFWFAVILLIILGVVNTLFSVAGSFVSVQLTEDPNLVAIISSVFSSAGTLFTMPFFVIALTVHYLRGRGAMPPKMPQYPVYPPPQETEYSYVPPPPQYQDPYP